MKDIYKRVSEKLKLLITDNGLVSEKTLGEYLNREEPVIASQTVYNALSGKSVSLNTLNIIAKGLGVTLDCLFSEDGPCVNEYLHGEVAEKSQFFHEGKIEKKDMERNSLEWYRRQYDLDRRFYPDDVGDLCEWFPCTTLAELTIYLPLLDLYNLFEILSRIGADVISREYYVLEKYKGVIKAIPDIPAKQFAEYLVESVRLYGKRTLTFEDEALRKELECYKESEGYQVGYNQYFDILRRRQDFYREETIQMIDKRFFPELYSEEDIAFDFVLECLKTHKDMRKIKQVIDDYTKTV